MNTWQALADDVQAVECDDEDLAFLFFGQTDSLRVRYLTLSRLLTSDKDVYIERDDQGWRHYGGIEKVVLKNEGLEIRVDATAATSLGGIDCFQVSFAAQAQALLSDIEKALKVIFAKEPSRLIRG